MSYQIEKANRKNGDWVIGYCPHRASPCGNPLCVDEAMRAKEICHNGDPISKISSDYAFKHAEKLIMSCYDKGTSCPLGKNIEERKKVIDLLAS